MADIGTYWTIVRIRFFKLQMLQININISLAHNVLSPLLCYVKLLNCTYQSVRHIFLVLKFFSNYAHNKIFVLYCTLS